MATDLLLVMDAPHVRLDAALVARGHARSRAQAHDLIAADRVLVGGVPARKSSQRVTSEVPIVVLGEVDPWVGRAAYKLLGALETFGPQGLRVTGRRCLDVGASTGGFTQVLLEAAAAHVVALDVGHGQLVPTLAGDARVDNREGVNIRDVTAADFPWPFDVVVADVSFISLTLVVPVLPALLADDADVVVLVKPQFEVGRAALGKGGVVGSARARADAVRDVVGVAMTAGLIVRDIMVSPLPGTAGNREYVLWMSTGDAAGLAATAVDEKVAAMEDAL